MTCRTGLYLQSVKQLAHGQAYGSRAAEWMAMAAFASWLTALLALLPGWGARLAFLLLAHAGFMVLHLQICLVRSQSHPLFETQQRLLRHARSFVLAPGCLVLVVSLSCLRALTRRAP